MIVCSCNVLTDTAIREMLAGPHSPARVVEVYRQLGCRPQCGCCAATIQGMMREAASDRPASAESAAA